VWVWVWVWKTGRRLSTKCELPIREAPRRREASRREAEAQKQKSGSAGGESCAEQVPPAEGCGHSMMALL
jgi:hypothetical protein